MIPSMMDFMNLPLPHVDHKYSTWYRKTFERARRKKKY
jgi:hypothetical protein